MVEGVLYAQRVITSVIVEGIASNVRSTKSEVHFDITWRRFSKSVTGVVCTESMYMRCMVFGSKAKSLLDSASCNRSQVRIIGTLKEDSDGSYILADRIECPLLKKEVRNAQ